jgi:hypothetical protein
MYIKIRLEKLEERDHFEDLVTGRRIILKKYVKMIVVQTLFIWYMIGISGGFL